MYARLVAVHGRTIIELEKDTILVGRNRDCDVVLGEPTVSAHHCQLHRAPDGTWSVTDLGSKNGTWVNGIQVKESQVELGDELWFTKHCRFRIEAPHRGSLG